MEDIDVCRSSNTHNNMICLSCHGPNDLTLGYVSRDSSLIIGQLERIKLFYLYKCNRIENAWFSRYTRSGWGVPFLCVARCFFSFKNMLVLMLMFLLFIFGVRILGYSNRYNLLLYPLNRQILTNLVAVL